MRDIIIMIYLWYKVLFKPIEPKQLPMVIPYVLFINQDK